jgi:N-acetylneuraminate lyase
LRESGLRWSHLFPNHIPALRDLVQYLLDKGVDGLFVGGTTGEGIYMTDADRKKVLETVIEQVKGRIPVIAHVGAVASGAAFDLTRHAAEHGAAGVSSILPPLYTNWNALYRYFERISVSAPDLPLLIYLLMPNYDATGLMRELLSIPTIAGGKYTGPNMYEMRQIINLRKESWSIWSGMDEQCVYATMMGASGAIGSTLNIMPGAFRRIREFVHAGDHTSAQDLQNRANQVIEIMIANSYQPSLKEVLTTLGIPCGEPNLPYLPLTDVQRKNLHEGLAKTDFAELVRL